MIQGLQIAIGGGEMIKRMVARAQAHAAAADALDARIAARAGDMPFDVREEDGFKTLSELKEESQSYRDSAAKLELFRDHLVPAETYALGRRDLVLAELITREAGDEGTPREEMAPFPKAPIHGLKLTLAGLELRDLLEGRIKHHADEAERLRDPVRRSEDDPALLGADDYQIMADRHAWRAGVLTFIRDHVEPDQVYRLAQEDLTFGDLVGTAPAWADTVDCDE